MLSTAFTMELRLLAKTGVEAFTTQEVKANPPAPSTIDLKCQLLALYALDQCSVQLAKSELNCKTRGFFNICKKIAASDDKCQSTELAFFGGLGPLVYASTEDRTTVKSFRGREDVRTLIENISAMLDIKIEIVNDLLAALREVVFLMASDPKVDNNALLALMQRCWDIFASSTQPSECLQFYQFKAVKNDYDGPDVAFIANFLSVGLTKVQEVSSTSGSSKPASEDHHINSLE